MSIIFFGKIVVVSLGSLSIPVIGVFIINSFSDRFVEAYGFVEVIVADASGATSQTPDAQDSKKLKCKTEALKEPFDCEVEVIDKLTTSSNSHVKWSDLSEWTPVTNVLETKKFYKIKTNSSEFDKTQLKDIEVVRKDGTSLGAIKTIFISEKNKIIQGKTHFFVGQALQSVTASTIKDYQCAWKSAPTVHKECKIFSFSNASENSQEQQAETTMSSISFKYDETAITAPTEIKPNHYYLIEFTDTAQDSKELTDNLTDLIYEKDSTTLTADRITFTKISAVARAEQQLLILK